MKMASTSMSGGKSEIVLGGVFQLYFGSAVG